MRSIIRNRRLVVAVLAALAGMLPPALAEARWAADEDAAEEVEYQNSEITVRADGTSVSVTETRMRVLKESARARQAIGSYEYNSNIQTFEVLEAFTVAGDKTYKVERSKIEDKPLASSALGFDERHQVMVPFPNVEVGASVHTKLRVVTKDVPLPGFWSMGFTYGMPVRERAGRVHIRSAIPLFVESNDPDHALRVTQTPYGKGGSDITIDLTTPVHRMPVDEPDALIDVTLFPWVVVSSAAEWAQAAPTMSRDYQAVLGTALPARFEAIRAKAAEKTGLSDRLNTITAELASQIRYLGDWRTSAGKFLPRDLATIAATQYGDCKDYAAATAAILRALGVEADVAWIYRGMRYRRLPVRAPLHNDFNHAIVYVRDGDGERWIDPTNFASFADGIYPDIAGRQALVLRGRTPEMLQTPDARPTDAEVRVTRVVHFAPDEQLLIDGTLALTGTSAIPYAGAALKRSTRSLDYGLAGYFGSPNELREWKVEPYDLTSRVVRDLEFHAHLVQRDSPMRTSAGDAFYLGMGGQSVAALLTPTEQRVSDLANGTPRRYGQTTELRDVRRVGRRSLDCTVESPWVDFKRTVKDVPRGVRIDDQAVVYMEIIPNADLKSERFAEVQARVRQCLTGSSVVYERLARRPKERVASAR